MNWIKKLFNINKVKEIQNSYCSLFYRNQSLQNDINNLISENNKLRKELSNTLLKTDDDLEDTPIEKFYVMRKEELKDD